MTITIDDTSITGSSGAVDFGSSNITTSGTIPAASLTGAIPAISGASMTGLNATQLASGTVPDARLPANVPNVAPGTSGNLLTSTGSAWASSAASGVGITLGAALSGADQTVSRVNLQDYGEVTNAIGSVGGGTQDIDVTLGNNVTATVDTSTTTFTFSNPTASDELCGFTLFLTNGGSQTVNWPATVDFPGGTAPTLTASGVDILVFVTTDGGTIWHGMASSLDSKTP